MNTNYNMNLGQLLKNKWLLTLCLLMGTSLLNAQNVKDSSFQVSANVNASNHSIKLNWIIAGGNGFQVHRKPVGTNEWVTYIGKTNTSSLTDTSAKIGVAYDYRIMKLYGNSVYQIGYISSGINLPLVDFRNAILIVIDSTNYNALSNVEKTQWLNDYIADGFLASFLQVSPTAKPPAIKAKIKTWYDKSPLTNTYCLLIGKVAVPYSGLQVPNTVNLPPDAHTDHGGAWPTDCYYADMDGDWTDDYTMVSGVGRVQNQNNPSDGKFDQHFIPSDLDIQIGRVDLSNLPSQPLSELQLIKQYLRKLHQFKASIIKPRDKAFISDNFGFLGGEMPMRSGWNNASALVGSTNINTTGNFMDSVKANSYIFTDLIGGGWYTTCNGIYTSANYKDSLLSVFNVQFGSYFGDWDNTDNFLRSCLASKGFTLTTCWAARPHWYFQHMALGYSVGFSTILSQNNSTDMTLSSGFMGSYNGSYLDRRISMTLMGDPSLRMKYCDMPKSVTATNVNANKNVKIDWAAANEPGMLGYHIYRATDANNLYFRITTQPVTGLTYTDIDPYAGNNHYLVKTVKLENSNAGSYYNTSIGAMVTASGVSGTNTALTMASIVDFNMYPNPANASVHIEVAEALTIEVMTVNGQIVYSTNVDKQTNSFTIQTTEWAKGVYIVKVNTMNGVAVKKLIVQ
ncbi:MAG: T9SS type A sorting domain-containing protein [bacterium]|nr:T9SS type A sorting domain-containing protein [bacterium]